MTDHKEQIIIPVMMTRGPVLISAAILYSLDESIDIMNDDDFITALIA